MNIYSTVHQALPTELSVDQASSHPVVEVFFVMVWVGHKQSTKQKARLKMQN
jgi:hypothetical protein